MKIVSPADSTAVVAVDKSFGAVRLAAHPSADSYGHYRAVMLNIGAGGGLAAASTMMYFRWADPSALALIHSFRVKGILTSSTSNTEVALELGRRMLVITSTAAGQDQSGSGGYQKGLVLRGSFPSSRAGTLQWTSSAALIIEGTDVVDPFAVWHGYGPGPGVLFDSAVSFGDGAGEHPIVLQYNEALIVRTKYAISSGALFTFEMDWTECMLEKMPWP